MELNRKNSIRILLIIFIAIIFFTMIQNFQSLKDTLLVILNIFNPFIIGLCFAFVINIPMRCLEKKVFNRKLFTHKVLAKIRRPLCLLLSLIFILLVITIFMLLIIPEIRQTVITVAQDLPKQVENLSSTITTFLQRFDLPTDQTDRLKIDWKSLSNTIITKVQDQGSIMISTTLGFTGTVVSGIFNLVLGFAFSIYLLIAKERLIIQSKKLAYAILPPPVAAGIFRITVLSNRIFSNFVIGQCTEALILGSLCYIGMLIFSLPYGIMISSLIAVTALVPVFGAFIGTAVGALMILLQNPLQAFWFVIFIIVLQQFESNIIYPKVVGESVGLPGIWVLLSVTVGGSLFGALGMLVSVPVCAVLYCLLREFVAKRLIDRQLDTTKF